MEITRETRKGRLLGFTEEDYFPAMGTRDGYLYVDGGLIADMVNFDEIGCYCCVDIDGQGYARDSWDGKNIIANPDYEDTFKAICEKRKDCYAVVVDLHD